MPEIKEGWGFPGHGRMSKKAHYFVDMMSLCGKWGFYNGPLETDDGVSTDDCAKCRRMKSARDVEEGKR